MLYVKRPDGIWFPVERRCFTYADSVKADGIATPEMSGYATIGLFQGMGVMPADARWNACPRALLGDGRAALLRGRGVRVVAQERVSPDCP